MTNLFLAGLALSALTVAPAFAERVYFNDFEAEGTRGTRINQRALDTVDVLYGRIDVITDVNRFGYAPRGTFLDLGGGLVGGAVSPRASFAFKPGDLVEIKFDASGNQLRPKTADYFAITLDITEQGGEAEEFGYLEVSDLGGTGAFDWVSYWPECEGCDPPPPTILIFEGFFASWGGFGFAGSFPGDYPWTPSSLYFVAQGTGRIDFDLSTVFGGYGPLIDNLAIDITPTGIIIPPCGQSGCNGSSGDAPDGGPASLGSLRAPLAAVTAVPAPGGIALFGLGLLGLSAAAAARRR